MSYVKLPQYMSQYFIYYSQKMEIQFGGFCVKTKISQFLVFNNLMTISRDHPGLAFCNSKAKYNLTSPRVLGICSSIEGGIFFQ